MRTLSQSRRLGILLGLNISMIAGLVVVGLSSRSLGVLAAAGDFVADSAAIALGLVAVALHRRSGETSRAPTFVATINAVALLVLSVLVMVEAGRRLLQCSPVVHGVAVLIVSSLAAVVMLLGALVLGLDAGSEDLHMRSVLLDTVGDAAAAAAVAVSGAVIALTHRLFWLDSALSLVIAGVIALGALRLLRDVVRSLRTGHPLEQ